MKEVAKRLKELREAKGLTCKEVANELLVSLQTYKRWENGLVTGNKGTSTFQFLIRVRDFYGVTLDFLAGHQIAN